VGPGRPTTTGPRYQSMPRNNTGPIPQIAAGVILLLFALLFHHQGFPAAARVALAVMAVFFVVVGIVRIVGRARPGQ
jgi:uncharacterized membrane protein HdeD (DUF308 family)